MACSPRRSPPTPAALLTTLLEEECYTLLRWARTEGSARHPEIAAWFESRVPFTR